MPRDPKGRFQTADPAKAARAADRDRKAAISERAGQRLRGRMPAAERRLLSDIAKRGVPGTLYKSDRRLALAMARERQAMLAELPPGAAAQPSVAALADVITTTRMLLTTVDGALLALGSGIVNRRLKTAAPLLEQRQRLADSLVQHLAKFFELRLGLELEKRVEALEGGRRTIDADL